MQVLRTAASEGSSLADEQTHIRDGSHRKLDMDAFEARCVLVRWQLEQACNRRAATIADKYNLPHGTPELQCRNLELHPPEAMPPAQVVSGISGAREKAEANLGWLPAPSSTSETR
eukprot:2964789-Prymnesium_polylepis.1